MINVSSDIVSSISTNVAGIISQLWGIFSLLFGVIIAFYIIRKIIFLFIIAKR